MNRIILILAILQSACVTIPTPTPIAGDTSGTIERHTPQKTAMLEEPESGEVFYPVENSIKAKCALVIAILAVHLRAEPSASSHVINWLPARMKITTYATTNGWSQVLADGQNGFVKSEFLGECQ